jgi:hypothetical protein
LSPVQAAGHLAVGYFVGRARGGAMVAALVGAILPDLIDKPAQLFGLTPYGRSVGHSLIVWSLLWIVSAPRSTLRSVAILRTAIASASVHLATDLVDDVAEGFERSGFAFSGWFGWPVTDPDMWNLRVPHAFARAEGIPTLLELATIACCLISAVRHRG